MIVSMNMYSSIPGTVPPSHSLLDPEQIGVTSLVSVAVQEGVFEPPAVHVMNVLLPPPVVRFN